MTFGTYRYVTRIVQHGYVRVLLFKYNGGRSVHWGVRHQPEVSLLNSDALISYQNCGERTMREYIIIYSIVMIAIPIMTELLNALLLSIPSLKEQRYHY